MATMNAWFYILLCCIVFYTTANDQEIIVTTSYGLIRGITTTKYSAIITQFLGIPYAKPPVNNLRFMRPQKLDNWDGIIDATEYGSICMSPWSKEDYTNYKGFMSNTAMLDNEQEDCLLLNIFYPGIINLTTSASQKKPVMTFIHGGAYLMGSGSMTDSTILATNQDVIVVTINYRLSIFGFASTEDGLIHGNMGLFDQHAALVWIQENIAMFGGDATKVTIFGESAGADSVLNHLVSPMSNGLFRRAIIQSTYDYHKINRNIQSQQIESISKLNWNCSAQDSTAVFLQCLQDLSADELSKLNQTELVYMTYTNMPIIIDGVFLTDDPLKLLTEGRFNKSVDVIVGFNGDDGDIIFGFIEPKNSAYIYKNGIRNNKDALDVVKKTWPFFFGTDFNSSPNAKKMIYLIEQEYFEKNQKALDRAQALLDIFTHYAFAAISINIADAISSAGGLVYLYQFNFRSEPFVFMPNKPKNGSMLAGHAEDLFYVFGYVYHYGEGQGKLISRSMMQSWAEFAKTGQPKYLTNELQVTSWEPYNKYFVINASLSIKSGAYTVSDKLHRAAKLWKSKLPQMARMIDTENAGNIILNITCNNSLFMIVLDLLMFKLFN